jgi:hypothetical protein
MAGSSTRRGLKPRRRHRPVNRHAGCSALGTVQLEIKAAISYDLAQDDIPDFGDQ